MPPRKSGKRKRSVDYGDTQRVQNLFKDVMDGSCYEWVDPLCCIPFTMTRPISLSGVLGLMELFDGGFNGDSIAGGGISCGSDTPMVVKLTGTNLTIAYEHFRKKGYSEDKVKEMVEARQTWFGIVDGEHRHSAILRLIETRKHWEGYKWFVTVVKGGYGVERYRQLARIQNERHDDRFFIQYTFFDMISNMKTEYDRLAKVQRRVVGQDVVDVYCGYSVTSKKVSTLIQTANTVIRLPVSVINAIGEVCNAEHPELVLRNRKLNRRNATTVDEAMKLEDCRVYRNLLHITSLKSAKAFMNAKHKDGERAQIYTIYRVQDVYKERCFSKSIQPEEVSRQYELALYSIEEEAKFIKYISPDDWPREMHTIRQNLLSTTQLSDEVESNHGNKEVLPSLLRA